MIKYKIVTASENPVKKQAVKDAFTEVFKKNELIFLSTSVPSGVSDQPKNNEETFNGAKNRAENAKTKIQDADFWVGIEGGTEKNKNETRAFAWIYIISDNKTGKAKTASFFLPKKITDLLDKGYELGEADDIIFNKKDSKKKNGAVGILTKNTVSRAQYYKQAVILALIPFINNELY